MSESVDIVDVADVIVVMVKVEWLPSLQSQLHNEIVYLISHFGERTNKQVRNELAKWLKNSKKDAYTSFKIGKIIRTTTEDTSIHQYLMHGFIHVQMESMVVSYYSENNEDDEEGEK